MHTDLFEVELWQVTTVTDTALSIQLQVIGPLGTAKVILSRGRNLFRRLPIGEEIEYDVAILVKNLTTNEWIWQYLDGDPKWLYVVVTDAESGWYNKVFRIEGVVKPHARRTQYQYHAVVLGKEMEQDKVWYEGGTLYAKG